MVSKVVLSPSANGRADLRISDVGSGLPARTPVGTELHLGSQDLIRLAAYASARGFVVSSFMVSDAYLVPLVPDEQAEVSDDLVEALRAYGSDEVEAALQNEYDGLYIVGVNLIGSASGMRISVRRRGYVDTSVTQEAEQLLKSAWRELRLS
ncbi:hypothetical protein [Compostimonas suwonensis]|uniref:Uncharacterized protein n=1 Tax=Compostimonas suwonensis TaxID=1048394 RepID=A0A2M9BBJ8_9MICO|nr:hypothetical protein [Compostimonas suwonensis]PJJ55318.1 hypothetical protein CLV54_3208 [Compostimonas suwonensis]